MLFDLLIVFRFDLDPLADPVREFRDGLHIVVAHHGGTVRFSLQIVLDPGTIGISVSNSLIALPRHAFRYRGIDPDFGAGRYNTGRHYRQAGVERFRTCSWNDHD